MTNHSDEPYMGKRDPRKDTATGLDQPQCSLCEDTGYFSAGDPTNPSAMQPCDCWVSHPSVCACLVCEQQRERMRIPPGPAGMKGVATPAVLPQASEPLQMGRRFCVECGSSLSPPALVPCTCTTGPHHIDCSCKVCFEAKVRLRMTQIQES